MKTRYIMELDLRGRVAALGHAARTPRPDDREQLAELMLAAYRGAADDDGETIAEARAEIADVYDSTTRPFMPEASFVVEIDGALVSASLISLFRGAPLVTHLMTDPRYKRRGLGTSALQRSVHALVAQGWTSLTLYVTATNTPAVALYEKLGFTLTQEVERAS